MPCKPRVTVALLSIMATTACATTLTTGTDGALIPPVSTTKPDVDLPKLVACEGFGTISFSAQNDSAETIRQVREHNAAWRAICLSGDVD